jgi:16S rRNA (guanine966-N2)-methyltransferase
MEKNQTSSARRNQVGGSVATKATKATKAITLAKATGKAPTVQGSHTVRIVGGRWKRSKLPVAALPGLRPTPDRVRETVFNWLGQDLGGWRCVDAFAGTGALGFEAASRGASDVLLIEQERALVLQLAQVKERFGADMVRIQRGDGVAALTSLPAGSIDLVFLDPPFDSDLIDVSLRASVGVLRAGGLVYLEAPTRWDAQKALACGFDVVRYLKAGAVHAHLLRRAAEAHA